MPIVDAVLEEFEQTYHLLHCFPDVRSLVEPISRIEEIQRVQFVMCICGSYKWHNLSTMVTGVS